MQALIQDIRYGCRLLVKRPGFTLLVVVTLAVGIGAVTAILSVVQAVVLRPLPYEEPERLVRIWGTSEKEGWTRANISYPNFVDWKKEASLFEDMAIHRSLSPVLTGVGEPVRLRGSGVSSSFFGVLGVEPMLGRSFLLEEDVRGNNRVVILSHGLWRRRFGADAGVVGRTIPLNGNPHTVVGVLPERFESPKLRGLEEPEIWIPLGYDYADSYRSGRHLRAIGRLRPDVTVDQAQAEMNAIFRQLELKYPDENRRRGLFLEPLHVTVVGDAGLPLAVLSGAVGLVLFIACANVANLLLARATSRQKEMAVRLSLGAGRFRLVQQLLAEAVSLSLLSGALGIWLAWATTDLLVTLGSGRIPRLENVAVDVNVLSLAFVISVVTGVLLGLAPAMQASRVALQEHLKEGGARTAPLSRTRLRAALVVGEVALAVLLLFGSGLLLRSLAALQNVDPGFDPTHVLTLRLTLPSSRYPESRHVKRFYEELYERAGALPGVERVGGINILPLMEGRSCDGFEIDHHPTPPPGEFPCAEYRTITPDYPRVIGLPLIKGRLLTVRDNESSPPVALINETMGRRFFPDEDPLGKRLTAHSASMEIVGLLGDVKHFGLGVEAPPQIFVPQFQEIERWGASWMFLTVRARSAPERLAPALRHLIRDLDADLPVTHVRTMEGLIESSIGEERFRTFLLGGFALTAVLLAALGIYGVVAYTVSQRTREMGLRMTLGADTSDVLRLVVGGGMRQVAVGISLGLMGAFAVSRLIKGLLFEVSPIDPLTFVVVILVLTLVAVVATLIPAKRATRVDPIVALRYE